MSNGKWNGDERRSINIPVTKEQFTALNLDEKLWMMVKMFSVQVQSCDGRFAGIEKKQTWFRTAIVVILVCLAQWGVIKGDTIIKWVLGMP